MYALVRKQEDLVDELDEATDVSSSDPDDRFAAGVRQTLRWVLGYDDVAPMDEYR
jgi:hypothetical protein